MNLLLKQNINPGREVSEETVTVMGYANKYSKSDTMVEIGKNVGVEASNNTDDEGWYTVTAEFSANDLQAAALNLLPNKDINGDTLYVKDYVLKCKEITNADISTLHDKSVITHIGAEFVVPTAYTNGNESIEVKLTRPSGETESAAMGDTVILNTGGVYTLTYTASDADTPLVITVTAEYIYQDLLNLINHCEEMDLSIYTDESVKNLNDKVAEAKSLIADESSTKEEFDACRNELKKVLNALELERAVVTADKITVTSNNSVYRDYVLSNCIDGDDATFTWIAAYQTTGDYIQFEFNDTVELDGVTILNKEADDYLVNGDFQVSADGETWKTISAVSSTESQTINFDKTDAKYARILCTADARKWWKLSEVTFYVYKPATVDEDGYIISGMSIVKAKSEDRYENSYSGTEYSAVNMIDGNKTTMGASAYYFTSAGSANKVLTVIDLGKSYEIEAVGIVLPDSKQISDAFDEYSPIPNYRKMNDNGSGIYLSNSIPAYTDFNDFDVSPTAEAKDLVRLEIGGNSLDKGNWDPKGRGSDVCNKLSDSATYRYLSIWTPYQGGCAINEIKVKTVTDDEDGNTKITGFMVDNSGNAIVRAVNVPENAISYGVAYDENGSLLEVHKLSFTDGIAKQKFNVPSSSEYTVYLWQDACRPIAKPRKY